MKETLTDRVIQNQASDWVACLHGGREVTDAERARFSRWVEADERHAVEFRRQTLMVMLVRRLPLRSGQDAAAVEPTRRPWPWLAAAALLVVVISGWFGLRALHSSVQSYTTQTGEVREVRFKDGSIAYLNTRTRLAWLGGERERRVELLEGEAQFEVIADAARPFRVKVDTLEIQVLGTRFSVYRKAQGDAVLITVQDGSVRVRHPHWQQELRADQRLVFDTQRQSAQLLGVNAINAVKWREGALEANDEPLIAVLEELSRYTNRTIVAQDPRLAKLRVSGRLNISDVQQALSTIESSMPVTVKEQGNAFTLQYRSRALP